MRRGLGVLIVGVVLVVIGCTPPPTEDVLAVAYTNVDGIDGYDETADVLIAQLIDTNTDDVPSAGDTVVTNRYPLDFAAATFGTFQVTTHTVASVSSNSSNYLNVLDAAGSQFIWASDPVEQYAEQVGFGFGTVNVHDGPATYADLIWATLAAPSAPDTALLIETPDTTGDDPFVDVDILV